MVNDNQYKHLKKSELDKFRLGFEYNKTFADERRATKKRIDASEHRQ